MRIYWINEFPNGNIGMMARPKGNDWLSDEVAKLKMRDVGVVVSLLERHESIELGLEAERNLCLENDIEFISYPIVDRTVPKDPESFRALVQTISEKIGESKEVVIHCRMGIGRTSMLAAGILLRQGSDPQNVFAFLSEKRTLSVPDTEEQIKWIRKQHELEKF